MIKIEFPADRKDIALAIGKALTEIGQGAVTPAAAVESHEHQHEAEEVPNDTQPPATTSGSGDASANAAGGENLDKKGVPFNGEFCGKAAQPFYGGSRKKGQWKKRHGVDEAAYDYWYSEALAAVEAKSRAAVEAAEPEPEPEPEHETTSDGNIAASMFAAIDAQHAAADENTPRDAGQLMKWVSEQQAAGNITQQQVANAYTALQLPFDAIMNSAAYPVADNCVAIYNHLKGQIG